MSELAKAAPRAVRLEASFDEKTRELDAIRDSLNKSEERAKTDTLTGLPNRRALDEFFRKAQMAAMETGETLSILLIDIDHFKRFNDNFGHAIGDQVLRLVANALRERVREIDLPARYGGEELIAVLPGRRACRLQGGRRAHSPLDLGVSDHPPLDRRNSSGHHGFDRGRTISVGEAMADLIDRCDRALYLAKKKGRNRVVSENELESGWRRASSRSRCRRRRCRARNHARPRCCGRDAWRHRAPHPPLRSDRPAANRRWDGSRRRRH